METYAYSSPGEALSALLPQLRPLATERVPILNAVGRVLAEPVLTDRPSPPFDTSAMDGYAVRSSELVGALPIVGDARIGHAPPALPSQAAMKIATGAPVPLGADLILKHEDSDVVGGSLRVRGGAAPVLIPGTHIRKRAENAPAGAMVAEPGVEITAPVAGALAAFGVSHPCVHRVVRLCIIVTGDELVDTSATPGPHQIRDSNGPSLAALLGRRRWLECAFMCRIADDPSSLHAAMKRGLDDFDAVILTGGVSMGHRDFVAPLIRELGLRVVFHRLPQRPGKPLLAAMTPAGRPVLGLPGNPVSVMVTARRFAVPVLHRVAGVSRAETPVQRRTAPASDGKEIDLWWHRLVRLDGDGQATIVDNRGSGDLASCARSEGFIEVPPRTDAAGEWPYYAWAW